MNSERWVLRKPCYGLKVMPLAALRSLSAKREKVVFGIQIDIEANVCLVIAAAAAFNQDLMDCVAPEQGPQTFCIPIKAHNDFWHVEEEGKKHPKYNLSQNNV